MVASATAPDSDKAMQTTRRIKTTAGVVAIACVLGAVIGPISGMILAFDAFANSTQPITPAQLSADMKRSLALGAILIPLALVAIIVWAVSRRRLRRSLTLGMDEHCHIDQIGG